jgi:serine/threonine protein kinase/tetratricopeptide (TPR) repeat protein
MSRATDIGPGAVLGSRFIIDREAGAGGMGTVFRAFDRVTGEAVALKVLRGQGAVDVERFSREAAILAELSHPAIVRYVSHGAADSGEHWLAMEWLDGEDLAQRLCRARLSLSETLALARRVADALACAHAAGMVHRDLKPGNLLLPGGDVGLTTVVDFGIARFAGDPQRLTCEGTVLGTLGYVAPEQIQEAGEADARADVFALGCVIFECLTGRPAFAGAHPMAVLAKILLEGPPLLCVLRPELPEALDGLVQRMLAKDPAGRPRDAAEVVAELGALGDLEEAPFSIPAPRSASRSRPSIPPSSIHGPVSLGREERRLVSVVLAGAVDRGDATLPSTSLPAPPDAIERVIAPYGGRVALQAGGLLVVTIWSNGDAADRAERAAQCALAIRACAPGAPLCVVTGRGLFSAYRVHGEVIDRGVEALQSTPPGALRFDEATADALGPRFELDRAGGAIALRRVRSEAETEALLLGKPAPFVGRDRELGVLEGMYDGCAAEPMAGIVLVQGPCGAGKSRLALELLGRLERRAARPTVLFGRADSISAGSPLGMIADALRRAAGLRDGQPVEEQRRKLLARVSRRVDASRAPRVAAFLGEIVRLPGGGDGDEALRAARHDSVLMGDSMRAAWEDFLAAECAAGPLVLVLEDLHWGDAATVRLVDRALRHLADRPLLVLVLARPEVHTRFPGLWAERDLHIVRLGPLSRRSSEALVKNALGEGAGAEVIGDVLERGGGNPFHLQELVRAVVEGRGDALPASVLDAVEARLDAEGGEAKRLLRVASIFGRRFSRQGVIALTGGDAEQAAAWLARLEARELVAPGLPGDADYVFRHALVREAAYATLTDEDRALGHLLAGDWLEQTGHTDAMAMATHFRLGEEPRRAAPWYLRAAEQSLEASELGAALERAAEGMACAGGDVDDGLGPVAGALRLVQAEAHVWRGELAAAHARGDEAVALLEPGTEPWFRAVTQVILAGGKLGDVDQVTAACALASATLPLAGAAGARLCCLGFGASYLIFGGRYDDADRLLQLLHEALRGPVPLDARPRAIVHQAQGFRASAAGDLGGCRRALTAALAAFEEASDHRNACAMQANLGQVYAELGSPEHAEEALRASLAAADRMGLCDLATCAQSGLGRVLAQRGRTEEARLVEQRAVEAFAAQGNRRLLGVAQVYQAEIALAAGDFVVAERAAREAVGTLAEVRPLHPFASAVLSRALLRQDRVALALAVSAEAYAAIEEGAVVEEGEPLVRLARAEALLAAGLHVELRRVLAAARERLLERAERIRDPAWRERFLRGAPDNARTLELSERWA